METIFKYDINLLLNIRSKYILQQIFDYLNEKRCFKIIKYNKNIQKKLDLNINHYKHFQKIEIELFPLIYEKKNYFINIKNNKYKRFFHIYFND